MSALVISFLGCESPPVRVRGDSMPPQQLDEWLEVLQQSMAVRELGMLKDCPNLTEVMEASIERHQDLHDRDMQCAVIREYGLISDRIRAFLRRGAQDDAWSRAAVRTLIAVDGERSKDTIRSAVRRMLTSGQDIFGVFHHAFPGRSQLVPDLLMTARADPDSERRCRALWALALIRKASAQSTVGIEFAFVDSSSAVRAVAAMAYVINAVNLTAAERAHSRRLLEDQDHDVAACAVLCQLALWQATGEAPNIDSLLSSETAALRLYGLWLADECLRAGVPFEGVLGPGEVRWAKDCLETRKLIAVMRNDPDPVVRTRAKLVGSSTEFRRDGTIVSGPGRRLGIDAAAPRDHKEGIPILAHGEAVLPDLLRIARVDQQPERRRSAVFALALCRRAGLDVDLHFAFGDPSPLVRAEAARAYVYFAGSLSQSERKHIRDLLRGEDETAAAFAVLAMLAHWQASRRSPDLVGIMKSENPWVRAHGLWLYEERCRAELPESTGDPEVAETRWTSTADGSVMLQAQALRDDEDEMVRRLAILMSFANGFRVDGTLSSSPEVRAGLRDRRGPSER